MSEPRALIVPATAPPGMDGEAMKAFVRRHFEDFVNRRDSGAALRNLSPDFLDHDEPYGPSNGNDVAQRMMEGLYRKWPDLHVTVEDAAADGDMVIVRNRWTFTDPATAKPMSFRGFVQWRFAGGVMVERWATVTPPAEVVATGDH